MMTLEELPNVGSKLAENLRRVGLENLEDFRAAGTWEAFLRIRAQVDPGACFHQLTALAGRSWVSLRRRFPQRKRRS